MDEQTTKTVIEVLTKEIRNLRLDIWLKDNQIADLKKELAETKQELAELMGEEGAATNGQL